jgi:hypothetical protein
MRTEYRHRAEQAREFVAARDPDLLRAAQEVDPGLLEWSLTLSARERLDSCTNSTRALARFRRVAPENR